MNPGRIAICVNVSSINSFVSLGTGGNALYGFGVEGVKGVSVPLDVEGSSPGVEGRDEEREGLRLIGNEAD